MFLFFIILLSVSDLHAHEFMHVPKTRRVSMHTIKEQAADAFSEQLRLAAEAVQCAGALQVLWHAQPSTGVSATDVELIRTIGVRMYQCRVQYADLFAPVCHVLNPFDQKNMSPIVLFGHLMQTIGAIQQYAITYLQDIFEDKGCVFIRQHANRLPDVVKTVTLYTQDFKALVNLLCGLEEKMQTARTSDTPVSSAKDSAVTAEKA